MTPQDKSKELIDKYIKVNGNSFFAKDCALIAVDEIIDILTFDLGHDQTARKLEENWQQIKNELLKQQNNG